MAPHESWPIALRPSDAQVTVHNRSGIVVRRGTSDNMQNQLFLCMFSGSQAWDLREEGSNALGFASATLTGIVFGLSLRAGGSCRLSIDRGCLHWPYADRAVVIATGGRFQLWCSWPLFSTAIWLGLLFVHEKSARRLSASPKSSASRRMPNRRPTQRPANLGHPVIAKSPEMALLMRARSSRSDQSRT